MKINDIKISTRLWLSFGLIIVFVALLGSFSILKINEISQNTTKLYQHPFTVTKSVIEIKAKVLNIRRLLLELAIQNDEGKKDEFVNKMKQEEQEVHQLFKIVFKQFLGDITRTQKAYDSFKNYMEYRNITTVLLTSNNKQEALIRIAGQGQNKVDILIAEIQYMIDFAAKKAETFYEGTMQSENEAINNVILWFVLILLSAAIISFTIITSIKKPLSLIIGGLRTVSKGNLNVEILIESKSELGELAASFQEMILNLKDTKLDTDRKIDYLNNIPTPVHVVDKNFNLLFVNKKAAEFIDKPSDECIGKKCYHLFNIEHCRTNKCRAEIAMREGKPATGESISAPAGKGSIPIRYTSAPLNDETGNSSGAIEYILDISDEAKIINLAEKISHGDYAAKIEKRSDEDKLSVVLNSMAENLQKTTEENDQQNWIKSAENEFNLLLQGNLEIFDVASSVIQYLTKKTNSQIGALYLNDFVEKKLKLTASYAFSQRKNLNSEFKYGEGLVGQAVIEKNIIWVTNVPDDYIRISSALGDTKPSNIIVLPFIYEKQIVGIIELGSINIFSDLHIQFLKASMRNLAIAINTINSRVKTEELLVQTQEMASNLKEQQEELRSTNEELAEQAAKLRESESELKTQQEELQATNEELEEKTEELQRQKSDIEIKNEKLIIASEELERKSKEVELTSKYKSEFLANMSHELRTPLNSLLLLAQNLVKNKEGNLNDRQIKNAQIIYDGGNDLLNMINEILDLSKIESGKMEMVVEEINLISLKQDIFDMFDHLVKDKGLKLELNIDETAPSNIYSDRQKLEQILKNLVSNAVKFTHEGEIKVKIYKPKNDVNLSRSKMLPEHAIAISVSDTGIGIPADKQLQIFEAFQQVDGSTSRKYGGTGLGLSICRELAKLLGGEIQLQSKLNYGSTFTVFIKSYDNKKMITQSLETNKNEPVADFEIEPIKEIPHKDVEAHLTKNLNFHINDDRTDIVENDKIILVIEDDFKFAKILYDACKDKGLKCLHAGSGEMGLELLKDFKVSGIILDISLPGINGLQVLDILKDTLETRHIPVHMISASEKPHALLTKGALGYLQKPVNYDELEAAFEKLKHASDKTVKKVLIIEDEKELCHAIKETINFNETEILMCNSGNDGLKIIKNEKIDLVILDINLPDISGIELLKTFNKLNKMLPIIVFTGKELTESENMIINEYASTLILKKAASDERLIDEVSLFLHSTFENADNSTKKILKELHSPEQTLKGKTVLIVDDDIRNLYSMEEELRELNLEVLKATDGKMAIEVLTKNKNIDIVLMDIMMPIMDGYEAIRLIRKTSGISSIPIIAVTAKVMKEDRGKCIEAGADDYLTKPVDVDKLIKLIRVWIKK